MVPLEYVSSFIRMEEEGEKKEKPYRHPFDQLPDLECHIFPPYVVINGGMKLAKLEADKIAEVATEYCESGKSEQTVDDIRSRLELVKSIWEMMQGAQADSERWGDASKGKRKRKEDAEDAERLSQASRRTTRSKTKSQQGRQGNEGGSLGGRQRKGQGVRNKDQEKEVGCEDLENGDGGQKTIPVAPLTETAVHEHDVVVKRGYFSRMHSRVKIWIDSLPLTFS